MKKAVSERLRDGTVRARDNPGDEEGRNGHQAECNSGWCHERVEKCGRRGEQRDEMRKCDKKAYGYGCEEGWQSGAEENPPERREGWSRRRGWEGGSAEEGPGDQREREPNEQGGECEVRHSNCEEVTGVA